jgi:hypothetical protein
MRWTAVVLAAVLLGSCIQGDASGGSPAPSHARDETDALAGTGTVVARVTRRCCFTEGSIFFIVVRDHEGQRIFKQAEYPPSGRRLVVRQALAAGRYQISTFERPCDGTCPRGGGDDLTLLDPPTSTCRWRVNIESGEQYILQIVTSPQIERCPQD